MTKYLLLLILLVVVFYKLTNRRDARPGTQASGRAPAPMPPKTIVACAQCGLHLPADEALPGRGGSFCSAAHRTEFEARSGSP
ncbi:MAG TPA: PP0621 family protein [Burkholderiaceae bacterium]|jgi:uncharacterized protein